MDDWGVEGEDRVPSPAPSPLQSKRRREERERGTDRTRAPDFQEKSARGAALLPESARNRMVATAAQRLPVRCLPQCGHCLQGTHASIGASYALMMHRRSLASMYLTRGTKRPAITLSPTRFGNELKPAIAHARGNRMHRPYHTRACITTVKSLTARGLGPRNRGPLRFSPRRQTLTIARFNRPDTRSRASQYILDRPAHNRLYETQRPQAPAAAPLDDSTGAYKPNGDYRKRFTPPPA